MDDETVSLHASSGTWAVDHLDGGAWLAHATIEYTHCDAMQAAAILGVLKAYHAVIKVLPGPSPDFVTIQATLDAQASTSVALLAHQRSYCHLLMDLTYTPYTLLAMAAEVPPVPVTK